MPKLAKLGVLWDPATGSVPLQALEKATASLSLDDGSAGGQARWRL